MTPSYLLNELLSLITSRRIHIALLRDLNQLRQHLEFDLLPQFFDEFDVDIRFQQSRADRFEG